MVDLFAGSGSATAAALMAERRVLALELSDFSVEAIKARIPLLYQKKLKEEGEISEDPEEDSKDKNPKPTPPVEERVCSICKKGPEAILTMCAHCGKLGHANCPPT